MAKRKVQQSNGTLSSSAPSTEKRRYKLLRGRFCEGSGPTLRCYRPGDIVETTQDLLKANGPGATKFLLISGDAAGQILSSSQERSGDFSEELDEDLLAMTKEELRVMCEAREIPFDDGMDVPQLAKLIQEAQEVQ